jgi:arylsulfatase A-like enzyme
VVHEPVSTLDLAATFYDYTGIRAATAMQSRSLRSLLAGTPETREVAYSEWYVHPSRCGIGLKLRTVRTRTYKCTFELDSSAGELYDLVLDPEEMVNRFDDPGYATVRKELEEMMRARPGKLLERLPEPVGMA